NRRRKPRDEDLLVPLRERDDRDAREVELLERGERSAELALSPVDDHEVRHPREALVELAVAEAREAARDGLAHRADVVLPVETADRKRAVIRVLRAPVHEDRPRRDDRLALDVRDVEALDPYRKALEIQYLAELLK